MAEGLATFVTPEEIQDTHLAIAVLLQQKVDLLSKVVDLSRKLDGKLTDDTKRELGEIEQELTLIEIKLLAAQAEQAYQRTIVDYFTVLQKEVA